MTKDFFYFSLVALTLSFLNVGLNPEALSLKKNYAPRTNTDTLIQHEFSKVTAEEINDYLGLLYENEAYVVILDSRKKIVPNKIYFVLANCFLFISVYRKRNF